jgi:Uma2 family endonuclease
MTTLPKSVPRLYTAEELERFPGDARYELIEGELRPMSPTGDAHGYTSNRLSYFVNAHVYENDLGECFAAETGFIVARDPDTVLAPDFAFVAGERLPEHALPGFLPLAPDLVLETRSPGDTKREVEEKAARWLQAGVRLVWELDPKTRRLTVYRPGSEPQTLGIDDILSGEEVLPGFSLPIRRLFRDAPPAGR